MLQLILVITSGIGVQAQKSYGATRGDVNIPHYPNAVAGIWYESWDVVYIFV